MQTAPIGTSEWTPGRGLKATTRGTEESGKSASKGEWRMEHPVATVVSAFWMPIALIDAIRLLHARPGVDDRFLLGYGKWRLPRRHYGSRASCILDPAETEGMPRRIRINLKVVGRLGFGCRLEQLCAQ